VHSEPSKRHDHPAGAHRAPIATGADIGRDAFKTKTTFEAIATS
jgi:hypothetical protein